MLTTQQAGDGYVFKGGYPTAHTVRHAYDAADLNRAVQAYRYFHPTVSMSAIWKGNEGVTPTSDTPYAELPLDLSSGPWVIEMPAGALIGAINDLHQRFVTDLGLTGPDAGKGGSHLILPPGYDGEVPAGHHTSRSSTNRVLLMMRAIPVNGDTEAAFALMRAIRTHALDEQASAGQAEWRELGGYPIMGAPVQFESTLRFWNELHAVIDAEPPCEADGAYYGELAALGIVKGQPFAPDARMSQILGEAARIGSAQMRVQSFADRRPDRIAWKDRQWEWPTLRHEKGSLCWLTTHDRGGLYLDGAKTYWLPVPLRVPASLFWSITVYDAETRAEIRTRQNRAALRSMHELRGADRPGLIDLYFGPKPPLGGDGRWIETIPGRGWFAYFRIYGPEPAAFDGSWKPGDLQVVR